MELDLTRLRKERLELRDYQLNAARAALEHGNTLVVMPTALGKTFIAALLMAHFLKHSKKKMLFLTPTKPLTLQQAERARELLKIEDKEVAVVTGEAPPNERKKFYESARIICATPQTIRNDLKARRLDLNDFCFLVADEAHRAVGDYAYVFVGKKALAVPGLLVLGLTASPSAQRKKINEICENLGIKNVEIKSEESEDVAKFVQKVGVEYVLVDLPREFLELQKILRAMLDEQTQKLVDKKFLKPSLRENKAVLIALRQRLIRGIPRTYRELSVLAKVMNLLHAFYLLESQGISSLKTFLESLSKREKPTKAVLSLLKDFRVKVLIEKCNALLKERVDHPKIWELRKVVGEATRSGKSVIVFAHYRDSVKKLTQELNALKQVRAIQLIGRAGAEGMKQKQQAKILKDFNEGKHNVLVCTSIGEEGLDLRTVELVVFYEAVPSEIRLIQRRGRTGRIKAGQVVILIAKGTRDEAYFWSARRKEEKMKRTLEKISRKLGKHAKLRVKRVKKEVQKSMKDFL